MAGGRSARVLLAAVGVVAVVVVALVIGGVFDGDDDDSGDDVAAAALVGATEDAGYQNSEDDLYAISAAGGGIRRAGAGLRITLRAPGRSVLQFADRPLRQAERLTLRELVRRWDALGFAQDPPNASLDVAGTADDETLALEIERPRLRGDSVEFTARVLSGGDSRLARSRSFGAASLFIDPSGNTTSDAGTKECGTTGEIVIFAGNFVPEGMVVANATYPQSDYPGLFRLVGSRFGKPSGSANFVTPGLKPIDGDQVGDPDPGEPANAPLLIGVCAGGSEPTPPPSDPSAVADGPGGCPVGEVRFTGLAGPHAGWLPTDGRTLDAKQYPLLAAALGTTGGDKPTITLPKVNVPAPAPDVSPDAQICVHGVSRSEPLQCPTGSLRLFAGPLDSGMIEPKGQLLGIGQDTRLFAILGTAYGGNGRTSFALPQPQRAPSGLHWAFCNPGAFPNRSELDPKPQPGVVQTIDQFACDQVTPSLQTVLTITFPDGPGPFDKQFIVPFGIPRVVDHCNGPFRTIEFKGGRLVINGPRGQSRFTGQLLVDEQAVAELRFGYPPGADGTIVLKINLQLCKFLRLDSDDCNPDTRTLTVGKPGAEGNPPIDPGPGTFTLTPGMDAVGARPLYPSYSTPLRR